MTRAGLDGWAGLLSVAISHTASAQELDLDYRAVIKGRPLLKAVLTAEGNYLRVLTC